MPSKDKHPLRIDKTTFLEFLQCPKNAWLKLHKPELWEEFELSPFEKLLAQAGREVEKLAETLFPQGTAVRNFGQEAANLTRQLMDKKTEVIFQPTFVSGCFLARSDILKFNATANSWELLEIKATNSLEENGKQIDHVADAAFQYEVMAQSGVAVGKVFLVHLNKEYIRGQQLEVNKLFIVEDITEKVQARLPQARQQMEQAKELLLQSDEKKLVCPCILCGRCSQCTTFAYSHPEVPEYSVHDLARIGVSKQKLHWLVSNRIYDINQVPESLALSLIQNNQIKVYKTQQPIVDIRGIKDMLSELEFPLYFLDYETYGPAIPKFPGFRPYQQIPFQFSLHVLESLNAETENYEYLHEDRSDPTPIIIDELRSLIGPKGSVIVWNQSFEKKINKELAERSHKDKEFLENINERIFDLMDIFRAQFYVHPNFHGKTSIKKVLPVLAPEMSYLDLDIREGATASQKWFDMVFGATAPHEKEKILSDLMEYCGLDTLAMYAIWKHLNLLTQKTAQKAAEVVH